MRSAKYKAIITGAQRAMPVVLGYVPIGFAYGVLAGKSGISEMNTFAMSLLLFAGSAQFIAVGLFAAGAGPAAIILTTFIVNLRHLLMAASLAPFLSRWKRSTQAFFAFELTDETFALHSTKAASLETCTLEALSLNVTAQSAWVFGGVLGILAAGLIDDIRPLGLDYALSAMFIGLLVGQCLDFIRLLTAIIAGIVATTLYLLGLEQLYVIVASVISATIGLGVEQWIKQKSS
ncbi:AzlC family ABC transporter permease [Desulfotalea psychrophila]|uniref:Related to branched-chain amino acid transport permease (AzlC) n=1 Tax=Desulfotalea psychrophila (strain LSv54 / DSM 12343) TaxID=177439 RepID=Q6AKD1_DESPS|nr:AzlC family ABC transporter permease [Desulfotalea psychrophila]CAG37194.1 related to branched-chain amino acid transport permease (AzlC) [Desulfotalea psychrophila LSv54]